MLHSGTCTLGGRRREPSSACAAARPLIPWRRRRAAEHGSRPCPSFQGHGLGTLPHRPPTCPALLVVAPRPICCAAPARAAAPAPASTPRWAASPRAAPPRLERPRAPPPGIAVSLKGEARDSTTTRAAHASSRRGSHRILLSGQGHHPARRIRGRSPAGAHARRARAPRTAAPPPILPLAVRGCALPPRGRHPRRHRHVSRVLRRRGPRRHSPLGSKTPSRTRRRHSAALPVPLPLETLERAQYSSPASRRCWRRVSPGRTGTTIVRDKHTIRVVNILSLFHVSHQ